MMNYNPTAQFQVKEWDVEFRRAPKRMLMARVYQPQGPGPSPTLLDMHGGAWHDKDRFANVPMCQAAARSGILAVAIDMTNSPEAPYPASVQDASLGLRWLKSKAAEWKGDPSTVGILGSSSGGHVAQLIGMRPRDPRYNALPGPAGVDATVAYVATRSPISDPHARYEHMVKTNRPEMEKKSKMYFDPWDSIFEANPMKMLERGEKVTLPPMLVMQGELDSNV
ncbi:MAG: alpha/beta hydrolase, partial [Burkholderiales bacterium]